MEDLAGLHLIHVSVDRCRFHLPAPTAGLSVWASAVTGRTGLCHCVMPFSQAISVRQMQPPDETARSNDDRGILTADEQSKERFRSSEHAASTVSAHVSCRSSSFVTTVMAPASMKALRFASGTTGKEARAEEVTKSGNSRKEWRERKTKKKRENGERKTRKKREKGEMKMKRIEQRSTTTVGKRKQTKDESKRRAFKWRERILRD